MKDLFFMVNFLMGQFQGTQPQQSGVSLGQELEGYSLPGGPIIEDDIMKIKAVIQQVLKKISESLESSRQPVNKTDVQPIMSGIMLFQDWLKRQGCVNQASNLYVEAVDKYSNYIFLTYPGQVPFDIVFNMKGGMKAKYRLLVFVTTVDLLDFASLNKNEK